MTQQSEDDQQLSIKNCSDVLIHIHIINNINNNKLYPSHKDKTLGSAAELETADGGQTGRVLISLLVLLIDGLILITWCSGVQTMQRL